jgi:hypothetical protein
VTGPSINDPLARYGFISWLRRGVATQIGRLDGDPGNAPRATVTVHLGFNADSLSVDVPLELFGSGEVASVESFNVTRTWPGRDAPDAETNYFPLIEFRVPDLPWRLTPASGNAAGRLRPWIVLVVLADDEATYTPPRTNGALGSIVVASTNSLPDLEQSWAWAHVQVANQGALDANALRAILVSQPNAITSRLLCPRRLRERTRYTAYVVPAFERGRLAGQRLEPGAIDGMVPAWTPGQAGVTLPIFHHWSFYTELDGDFESLVRRLQPRVLPKEVGIRDMDVANPRGALHGIAAHSAPLGLEGALRTVRTETTPWPASTVRSTFIDRLTALVNTPAAMLSGTTPERVVAPPLYAARHAAADTLNATPGALPAWFHELNQDPRLRTTSGLGTQVVQANQRALMASAWQQVEGIRTANEERRRAQLARAASLVAFARHIVPTVVEDMVMLTRSLHARVKGSPVTIRALLDDSPIPSAVVDTTWRRVTRPLGALGRRQGRPGATQPAQLLDRLNRGMLLPGKVPPPPPTLPTIGNAGSAATPIPRPLPADPGKRLALWVLLLLVLVVLLLAGWAFGVVGLVVAIGAVVVAWFVAPDALRATMRSLFQPPPPVVPPTSQRASDDLANERFDPGLVREFPAQPGFVLRAAPPLGMPLPDASATPGPDPATDSTDATAFRVALADLFTEIGAPVAAQRPMTQVDLPELAARLQAALNPRITVPRALIARTRISADVGFVSEDPIDEIRAYPKFPQPMYEALRDLGQDWLLPGLELIPGNTIALVVTNQRIIEAYMAGLNHEMGRELLWNEYPTELRGSYFRQFWDVRGVPAPGGDAERLRDITEMHRWKRQQLLGANSPRPPMPNGEERLVLLVRGDLFRRYPRTHVFAIDAKATTAADGKRLLGSTIVNYEFHGRLDPDVVFFGFPLTPSQAVGALDSRDATQPQGFFFVLQEQPVEPRFGLDAEGAFNGSVSSFSDLGWRHLSANAGEDASLVHIDLNRQLPDLRPLDVGTHPAWHADSGLGRTGTRSSHLAEITLQQPVFIAVHGSDMLRGT